MKRFLPVILFGLLAIALGIGLTLNPREIPTALQDKPVPVFSLPPLEGRADQSNFTDADLRVGELRIVNVWASWCPPCRAEHPLLMQLAAQGHHIDAINYKDTPDNARTFLNNLGDPFHKIGVDRTGRAAIDWGVYGVPETFVISGDGKVLLKHAGPLSQHDIETKLLPLFKGQIEGGVQ